MDYTYTYLILDFLFLIFWIFLFLWRKDIRKEMLFMSFLWGISAFILGDAYTSDWWHPPTITGTRLGIEDFLFGFIIGGIAAVIYEEIFKKKIKQRKIAKNQKKKDMLYFIILLILTFVLFLIFFYFVKLNSILSTIVVALIVLIIIYTERKDLIPDSLFSGALLLILAMIVYTIVGIIFPGWINAIWYFRHDPSILLFGVPISDAIWYFLAGAIVGPLYEFWKEGMLIDKIKKSKANKIQ